MLSYFRWRQSKRNGIWLVASRLLLFHLVWQLLDILSSLCTVVRLTVDLEMRTEPDDAEKKKKNKILFLELNSPLSSFLSTLAPLKTQRIDPPFVFIFVF